jgi:hypothetical protein
VNSRSRDPQRRRRVHAAEQLLHPAGADQAQIVDALRTREIPMTAASDIRYSP